MHVIPFNQFAKGCFKIAFLGDIMGQHALLPTIANDDPFKYIKKWLFTANYVVGGLETTFSGFTHDYEEPGYKKFSTNDLYADQLTSLINLVFTANNHSYDFEEKSVKRTIEVLNDFGIDYIGTNDLPKIKRVFDINLQGHKISFLNYTQFINSKSTPPTNLINFYDEKKVKETIKLAKERSEIVIVGIHLSTQEKGEIDKKNKKFLESILEMGADVVIGGHPHVFQGATVFEKNKIAVHSLASFYSAMSAFDNNGCAMLMSCDSYSNINYTFLPIATVKNEKTGYYYVIPMAMLNSGNYEWVTNKQRNKLLLELDEIRKTLRKYSLTEENISIFYI